jgi:hypothetical protein
MSEALLNLLTEICLMELHETSILLRVHNDPLHSFLLSNIKALYQSSNILATQRPNTYINGNASCHTSEQFEHLEARAF